MPTPVLTPLYTDHFTPDANPLNPAKWQLILNNNVTYHDIKAVSGVAEGTDVGIDSFNGDNLIAVTLPADCYVSYTLANFGTLGNSQENGIGIRVDPDVNNILDGWFINLLDLGGGGVAELTAYALFNNGAGSTTIYENLFYVPMVGDKFTLAVIGQTGYFYINDVLITSQTVPSGRATGSTQMLVFPTTSATEAGISYFEAGSAALLGPPTNGTVGVGQFFGATFKAAFTNPENLDVLQVVNQGGKVVWNLTFNGVASTNPASPTNGALSVYFGSSFAQAFNTNPDNLDVLQVVQSGTKVIFSVDYQGNAGSH